MFERFVFYALPFSFTVLAACALTALVSGIVLFVFRIRRTNEDMRHPYLDQRPWERYSFPIRAAILLDYFLRLAFPGSNRWIAGEANRLLGHVKPADISMHVKWPLYGLWGGCFVGLVAMVGLWTMILVSM